MKRYNEVWGETRDGVKWGDIIKRDEWRKGDEKCE